MAKNEFRKDTNIQTVKLPRAYHILPESIDFVIPGFHRFRTPDDKTLALRKRDCEQWFHEFVDRLVAACGREYLPVCRMGDGEFHFALGDQPPDLRLPLFERLRQNVSQVVQTLRTSGSFQAFTGPNIPSGRYSADEWHTARPKYASWIQELSKKGILALWLSYIRVPFPERYFPALGRWLKLNQINLVDANYVPFYFVYPALSGPRRGELLKNRRILVVNGAQGEKRRQIEAGLRREGVSGIHWCPISFDRSLYDQLNIAQFIGEVDMAVVGAGIGKPNILLQLEPLQVPCIDAGYMFEVWANPENKWKRAGCASDDDWLAREAMLK